ncbi:hypothetical protein HG531_008177 [Fusarium graminearum]|nr:hypothetical protein HG531_008177 [Fusarium graminearum]
MDGQRRVSPTAHKGALLIIKDGCLAAQRLMDVIHGERNTIVKTFLINGDWGNLLLDAGDLNLAASVDKRSEDPNEIGHGLLGSATKDTTVKTVGQAGLLGTKPVIIRNANSLSIGKVLLGLLLDQVVEAFRAIFLHTLKAHEQVNGEVDTSLLMSLNSIQPAQDGALVVCRSTSKHAALVVNGKVKGLGGPTVALLGRLNIVMAIDEDSALVLIVSISCKDNGRKVEVLLVGLLSEGSKLYRSSESLELVAEPLSHADDIRSAGILGRNGGNGDSFAQTLNEVVGGAVDLLEETVKLGSHFLCLVDTYRVCEICARSEVEFFGKTL